MRKTILILSMIIATSSFAQTQKEQRKEKLQNRYESIRLEFYQIKKEKNSKLEKKVNYYLQEVQIYLELNGIDHKIQKFKFRKPKNDTVCGGKF